VEDVQRVAGDGAAAVERARPKRAGDAVVQADVRDDAPGGGVEDEAGRADAGVCGRK
jgi:hypothetical protein